MPIKNYCLLCNDILASTEERRFGSHFHCPSERRAKNTPLRILEDEHVNFTVKTAFSLLLFNSIILGLFVSIILTQI